MGSRDALGSSGCDVEKDNRLSTPLWGPAMRYDAQGVMWEKITDKVIVYHLPLKCLKAHPAPMEA